MFQNLKFSPAPPDLCMGQTVVAFDMIPGDLQRAIDAGICDDYEEGVWAYGCFRVKGMDHLVYFGIDDHGPNRWRIHLPDMPKTEAEMLDGTVDHDFPIERDWIDAVPVLREFTRRLGHTIQKVPA